MKITGAVAGVSMATVAMAGKAKEQTNLKAKADKSVAEVVDLLENMMEESAQAGKDMRKNYAKVKCFCDTTDKKKSDLIATNEDIISEESGKIEKLLGSSSKLSQEVADLAADMADNEAARKKAKELRKKENDEFVEARDDMKAAIAQMKNAISTLAAVGADQTDDDTRDTADTDFRASGSGAFLAARSSVKKLSGSMTAALDAAESMLPASQVALLQKFASNPGVYSSASGEIIGILKNMKDTFDANLAEAKSVEAAAVEAHDKFKTTKEEEHGLMDTQKTEKETLLGENDTALETARDAKQEAEEVVAAATSYLADMRDSCKYQTAIFEDKKKTRAAEEVAITQAISILSSDDAFATFQGSDAASGSSLEASTNYDVADSKSHDVGKQGNFDKDNLVIDATEFLQVLTPRQSVMKMLLLAAKGSHSLKLAQVAVALQSGNAFTEVLKTIDDMIKLIDEEEVNDDKKDAWCTTEQKTNRDSRDEYIDEIETLTSKINTLATDIGTSEANENGDFEKSLKGGLASNQEALSQCKKDQADRTVQRAEQKAEYLAEKATLGKTNELLTKAKNTLDTFYKMLKAKQGCAKEAGTEDCKYNMKTGTNSKGGMIERIPGASVEELKKACDAAYECVGFDTNGWLKSSIGEAYDSDGDMYEKDMTGAFIQIKDPKESTFDDSFGAGVDTHKQEFKSADSKSGEPGVVGLLQQIIDDTVTEGENADTAENTAVTDFDTEITALQVMEKALEDAISKGETDLASAKEMKLETTEDKVATADLLKQVKAYLDKIRPGCTFIQDNIAARKAARTSEKTALETAISKLENTPAFKNAELAAHHASMGDCLDTCTKEFTEDHVECKACLAKVSVPGYCAGHADTTGC